MPLVFLFIGVLLIVVGIQNKLPELGTLVKDDFSPANGKDSFPVWAAAFILVGAIGYVKPLKPISNAFLALVFLGLILSNEGFIGKFKEAFKARVATLPIPEQIKNPVASDTVQSILDKAGITLPKFGF